MTVTRTTKIRSTLCLSFVIVLALLAVRSASHPNCVQPVNGAVFPPVPNPPLAYCTAYGHNSDGACCTAASEVALVETPAEAVIDFADANLQTCAAQIKNIYCSWCNPYSGHLYQSEAGNGARQWPWLCQAYCQRFWTACSNVPLNGSAPYDVGSNMKVPGLTQEMGETTLAAQFASADDYCGRYASSDPGSCYTDNPSELTTIPGGAQVPMDVVIAYPNLNFNAQNVPLANAAWYLHITHLIVAPGSTRMFATFQHGVIVSWNDNMASNTFTIVIDIQANTYFDNGGGSEYGVMGVSLHPQFQTNGWMYVKHSYLPDHDRIIRYTVDRTTWIADPNSALVIMDYQMFGVMHHGAPPFFANDGMMMIANGDGTNYEVNGVAYNPAQDPNSLLGKILRINVDASTAATPYTIPGDNPFVNTAGWRPEIWAWGFRNPWRTTYDSQTDTVWVGSVGQAMFEGVWVAQRGQFHGWHTREAYNCYYPITSLAAAPFTDCATPGEVLPILEFPHDPSLCSIVSIPAHCAFPAISGDAVIGGYVYRGTNNPSIWGTYIFGNYQPDFEAYVYTVSFDTNTHAVNSVWRFAFNFPAGHDPNNWSISTLGLDSTGELLVVNINNPNEIIRFVPDKDQQPPNAGPITPTPQQAPTAAPPTTPSPSPSPPVVPVQPPQLSNSSVPIPPKSPQSSVATPSFAPAFSSYMSLLVIGLSLVGLLAV